MATPIATSNIRCLMGPVPSLRPMISAVIRMKTSHLWGRSASTASSAGSSTTTTLVMTKNQRTVTRRDITLCPTTNAREWPQRSPMDQQWLRARLDKWLMTAMTMMRMCIGLELQLKWATLPLTLIKLQQNLLSDRARFD